MNHPTSNVSTPRFNTLEELTSHFIKYRDVDKSLSLVLSGVEIKSEHLEEAHLDRPGWYFIRDDLRRYLPLKYAIHRYPIDMARPFPNIDSRANGVAIAD